MNFISPAVVEAVLAESKATGKFFSVDFEKKDGSQRTFKSVRVGVKKHLKGGVSTIAGKSDLVSVWSSDESYKCFSKSRVIAIRFQGAAIEAQ